MSRLLLAAALCPLLLAPAPAAPAPADKPAAVELPIPKDTLVVVQVRGVERTRGRLAAMLKAAAPDVAASAVKQFDDALANTLNGRDLKVLAPDARVYLAATSFEGDAAAPPVAVLLPVKDAATFKQKLLTDDERKTWEDGKSGIGSFDIGEKSTFVAELKGRGYVAVARSRDVAEAFVARFEPLTPDRMGGAVADAFLAADVSVYVNMAQVNADYGDKIRQGRQLFQVILQQAAAGGGTLDQRQMDLVKKVYDVLFQAAEDARGLAVGVSFQPGGLALRVETGLTADSVSAVALAGEQPAATPALADLPAGLMTYSAGKTGPKFSAALSQLGQEFRAEDDETPAKAFARYNELTAAAAAGGFAGAADPPGVAVAVSTPADPAALVAARLAAFRALTPGAAYQNVILKEKPAVAEGGRKVGGFVLHEVALSLDFDATVKGIPDDNLKATTIASMKRVIAEKPRVWFGTDGKRLVQLTAPDWPAAEKALAPYLAGKGTVGAEPAFRAARGELPAEASFVSLTEVNRLGVTLSESFADMTATVPGLPIGKLPKLKPSTVGNVYLGVAVGLKPTGVRFDLYVPADAVKVVREMLKPVLEPKAE